MRQKRTCPKIQAGFLEYYYDSTERTLQIIRDIPEDGTEGGTFYPDPVSFDVFNNCLDNAPNGIITSKDIGYVIHGVGSNYGTMFIAILLHCEVIEQEERGQYRVIGRL